MGIYRPYDKRTAKTSGTATVYLEKGDVIDFEFSCNGKGQYSSATFKIYAMNK